MKIDGGSAMTSGGSTSSGAQVKLAKKAGDQQEAVVGKLLESAGAEPAARVPEQGSGQNLNLKV